MQKTCKRGQNKNPPAIFTTQTISTDRNYHINGSQICKFSGSFSLFWTNLYYIVYEIQFTRMKQMAAADLSVMSRMRKEIVYRESKSKMRVLDPSELRPSHGMESVGLEMTNKLVLLKDMKDPSLNDTEARIRKVLKNGDVLLVRAGQKFTAKPENIKVCFAVSR